MKRAAILAAAFALILPITASSQTRKRATSRKPQTTPAQKSADVVQQGATRVAEQIKNLTRFIYVLGGVAKGIEEGDAAIRRNDASPAVIDQIKKSKTTVRTSLADVRAGLDKLELDFRSTPELNRYYTSLVGSAAGAANAEDQAAAGHVDQAGRTLLGVVNRLTDVLLEMK